jgi:hypothetical protein
MLVEFKWITLAKYIRTSAKRSIASFLCEKSTPNVTLLVTHFSVGFHAALMVV